jgi:hypothetical protein
LSGGSNSKKHLLSPIQFRFSIFLNCIYPNDIYHSITDSFHNSPKDSAIYKFDLNSKENIEIFDSIKNESVIENNDKFYSNNDNNISEEQLIFQDKIKNINENENDSEKSNSVINNSIPTVDKINPFTLTQKRKYHTFSILRNEKDLENKNIKISEHLSFYLNTIHDIIKNNNLNNKEAQHQIESS